MISGKDEIFLYATSVATRSGRYTVLNVAIDHIKQRKLSNMRNRLELSIHRAYTLEVDSISPELAVQVVTSSSLTVYWVL